jgi:hypothetical protein
MLPAAQHATRWQQRWAAWGSAAAAAAAAAGPPCSAGTWRAPTAARQSPASTCVRTGGGGDAGSSSNEGAVSSARPLRAHCRLLCPDPSAALARLSLLARSQGARVCVLPWSLCQLRPQRTALPPPKTTHLTRSNLSPMCLLPSATACRTHERWQSISRREHGCCPSHDSAAAATPPRARKPPPSPHARGSRTRVGVAPAQHLQVLPVPRRALRRDHQLVEGQVLSLAAVRCDRHSVWCCEVSEARNARLAAAAAAVKRGAAAVDGAVTAVGAPAQHLAPPFVQSVPAVSATTSGCCCARARGGAARVTPADHPPPPLLLLLLLLPLLLLWW